MVYRSLPAISRHIVKTPIVPPMKIPMRNPNIPLTLPFPARGEELYTLTLDAQST